MHGDIESTKSAESGLFKNLPQPAWLMRVADWRVLKSSKAGQDFAPAANGQPAQWDFPEMFAPAAREALLACLGKEDLPAKDRTFTCLLGRDLELNWAPFECESEACLLVVAADVTESRKAEQEILRLNAELEKRVRERTTQLEAINRELEAFSYSVSHDLRAPLRSVRGFSEVLLERYASQLDDRGLEFLKRACESCLHMDRLIEDLLKLSRVGRSELQLGAVDLSRQALELFEEIRKSDPERIVEITVAPGLEAWGDERLLRVALDNLLRNAWKFTRRAREAKIEVGRSPGSDPAFYVRDNGAGFDMTYAGKLFGVFQRLHTAAEFPGTGVGLATVQRVIARHGGRVWAEGVVNQGAAFYFSLPRHGTA